MQSAIPCFSEASHRATGAPPAHAVSSVTNSPAHFCCCRLGLGCGDYKEDDMPANGRNFSHQSGEMT